MNDIIKTTIDMYIKVNNTIDIIVLINVILGKSWSFNNIISLNIKKIDIIIFLISERIINC